MKNYWLQRHKPWRHPTLQMRDGVYRFDWNQAYEGSYREKLEDFYVALHDIEEQQGQIKEIYVSRNVSELLITYLPASPSGRAAWIAKVKFGKFDIYADREAKANGLVFIYHTDGKPTTLYVDNLE